VIETETHKDAPPPPPPPPQFERPPVEIPPTDTVVELPTAAATTAISNTTTQHVAAAPVVAKPTSKTPPHIDMKHFPQSEDYYPAASKRLNEEGAPTVHVCVAGKGGLSAAPTIATSSGSPRLDQGALDMVKAGAKSIFPATEDGKPVDSCFDFRIKFQMSK
jgi:TonB family protein